MNNLLNNLIPHLHHEQPIRLANLSAADKVAQRCVPALQENQCRQNAARDVSKHSSCKTNPVLFCAA
jgi:hypothetical protein